jgi:enediyne biosynthesis protein E4
MARPSKRRVALVLAVAAAATLAVAGLGPVRRWLGLAGPPGGPDDDARPIFHERALQSGLTFRMSFLPTEQGEQFKVNLYDHGSGLAVGDYDGDGHEDVYFCNQLGKNALYRNNGDGTFADVTERAGVGLGDRVCTGAAFADTLNNGRQDLYVTSTRGGNVFFRNNGDGTFTDATKEAGLTHVGHSQTAVFFDFDNDGFLDLFVTNSAQWTNRFDRERGYYPGKSLGGGPAGDLVTSPREYNILYRNNGDGTFTDVTEKAGLRGQGWGGDVAVLDYDGDGYLDLLVTNMFGPSQLYHNNGDGTFTEVTKQALGATSFGAVGCKAFDFNNDGRLDLFLADMHSDMWMGVDYKHESMVEALVNQGRKYPFLGGPWVDRYPGGRQTGKRFEEEHGFRYEDVVYGNTLFKNLGGGKFREVSDRANMETFWPWGAATGDFDNDGYEDVFIPSGMGYPFYYWPNQLRMNNGDETFTERARELGIEPPARGTYLPETIRGRKACRSSRCAAVADFDGDGRLDIMVNNFNDQPYYFRNRLPRRNYVAFRLRGTRSNRDAIGALLTLHVGKEILTRQVNPAGGYLSQSSKAVHFGLGDRPRIDRVVIRWPRGRTQVIRAPAMNRLHEVVEPRQ